MKKKIKPGRRERPPVLALALLLTLAVVSLVSAVFLQTNRTVASRAEGNCPGKEDQTGACNPACCSITDSSTCPTDQTCSVQNGYCKSGYSCKAKSDKFKRDCTQNICAWVTCKADDPTCCDTDTDPKCMYCNSNEECVGKNVSSSSSESSIPNDQRSNTCFNLTLDADAKKEQNGYTFSPSLKVGSPEGGGDGHIQLFVDGGSKGTNWGWNRKVNNPFVINPDILGTKHVDSGSVTVNYAVKIDECNERGNYLNITCRYAVSGGKPAISGPSCNCTNCDSVAPPASSSSASSAARSSSSSSASSAKSSSSSSAASSSSKSSSSSVSSSSSSVAQSSSSSSSVPAAVNVEITVAYEAAAGAPRPTEGGVCIDNTKANTSICRGWDVSNNPDTITFSVDGKDVAAYTAARAYVFDPKGVVHPKTTSMNLDLLKAYAIKINYSPATEI